MVSHNNVATIINLIAAINLSTKVGNGAETSAKQLAELGVHEVVGRARHWRRVREQRPVLLECVQSALVKVAQHQLLEVVEQRRPEAALQAVAEHSVETLGAVPVREARRFS